MRLLAALLLLSGAGLPPSPMLRRAAATSAEADYSRPIPSQLHISNREFVTGEGRRFQWRGITAFRLLELVARGRERDAERYLAWAHSEGLTVARVLAMARNLFDLPPEDGRAALPRLLRMADRHRMTIEVVALADTRAIEVDLDQHVSAIGRIIADRGNAVLEIANEPVHPTQGPDVQKPGVLAGLRARVPAEVPVALGSVEWGEGFASADYVTWHPPRRTSDDGWGHVLAIAEGDAMLRAWKKPVVSDEPIGAGERFEPGRRDDAPARFRAAALLTRLAGLGATFHYQDGLNAAIPTGRQLECFKAWNSAWTLLPADIERRGVFKRAGDPGAAIVAFSKDRALGVFERRTGDAVWVLVIRPRPSFSAVWAEGWSISRVRRLDGAWILTARRRGSV